METRTVEEVGTGPGLLEAVWQYRWAAAIVTLVAGAVGFAASFLQPTEYEAQAQLLLADPRTSGVFQDTGQTFIDPTRYVRNQAEFATSTPVLDVARAIVGSDLPLDDLRERVTVQASSELDLLTIAALDPTAEGAAALTNAVGEAYQQVAAGRVKRNAQAAVAELEQSIRELQTRIQQIEQDMRGGDDPALQAERDAAVAQLVSLESRARQLAVDASLYGSGVTLFERAQLPESPATPKPLRAALVAMVLGLMAASAWAWWRAEHTQSADDRQDAAPVLGAPLLGEVPNFGAVGVTGTMPAMTAPHSVAGEAYHFLVAALGFALERAGGSTVLITSGGPGAGKTVTAMNLAVAAVRDGRRTVLVDADERMRGLTRTSAIAAEPGLTDLADDAVPFAGCVGLVKVSDDIRLSFVPAGSRLSDPAGFFRTPEFRKALGRVQEQAELVIVDSPPLLSVADASAIASQVDGIVIVVTRGTPLRQLEEVRERLQFIGTPVLGYVFNRSDVGRGRAGYGYGYGYGPDAPPQNGSALPAARSRAKAALTRRRS
ncbi:MAG: AAA family ATPase [Euzebyales bacterium]|nr:AAA family ATPase [Euzebyales bacterium]